MEICNCCCCLSSLWLCPTGGIFVIATQALIYLRCLSSIDVPFLYCTLSPQTTQPPHRTADATLLVLNTFSIGTTGVTFLIMKTFSSHHTPCHPAAVVTLLILYTLSTHCTAFSLYCRCEPPGTAHFIYSYCRCDIPDTADFLLTPHTLSFYYRCSPSDTVTLSSHCTAFRSYTADAILRVLHTSSFHTTDVTFQMLQSFSLHQTHCDSMGVVA